MDSPQREPSREPVVTPGGVRPQRSTEEHGSGHGEDPGRDAGPQRLSGPGPGYPVAQAEPRAKHPGGDTGPTDPHASGGRPDPHAAEHPAGHPAGATSGATIVAGDTAHGGSSAPDAGHTDAHGEGHGDDAHAEPRVGPINVAAWGASALGILIGLGIAVLFYLGTLPK